MRKRFNSWMFRLNTSFDGCKAIRGGINSLSEAVQKGAAMKVEKEFLFIPHQDSSLHFKSLQYQRNPPSMCFEIRWRSNFLVGFVTTN